MNIFYSNHDPVISARNLDDKRVAKMALESAQLLQGVIWSIRYGFKQPPLDRKKDDPIYSLSLGHRKSPCSLWLLEARDNYFWLLDHFDALYHEHRHRYPQSKPLAAYTQCFTYCKKHAREVPAGSLTEPKPLMLDQIRNIDLPITGKYKVCLAHKYLYTDKRASTYSNRHIPTFVSDSRVLSFLERTFGKPLNTAPVVVRR